MLSNDEHYLYKRSKNSRLVSIFSLTSKIGFQLGGKLKAIKKSKLMENNQWFVGRKRS